jgi:quercetin dioxygenase-like cupin family protein
VRRSWPIALVALLALVASFAFVGTVLATHLPTNHNITTVVARGTIADTFKYNLGDIKVQTKGPVDIVIADVTFAALASAGWHSHPGPVFVVIKTGTLSVWDESCAKHTYGPGSSFFEPGPEASLLVKNESETTEATVSATFIVPPGTTALRIGTAHLCGIEE